MNEMARPVQLSFFKYALNARHLIMIKDFNIGNPVPPFDPANRPKIKRQIDTRCMKTKLMEDKECKWVEETFTKTFVLNPSISQHLNNEGLSEDTWQKTEYGKLNKLNQARTRTQAQ